jgi:large subunit ribosomal protein L19
MLRQLATKTCGALARSSLQSTLPSVVAESQQLTTLLAFRAISSGVSHVTFQSEPSTASAGARTAATAPNSPSFPAWTPTRELQKRKILPKRMGHLLQVLEKEKEEEAQTDLQRPDFGPGDLIELKLSVPENKRRTTVFKGICIAKRNRGYRTSFTLRNFIGNSGGIERTFPLYSPHVLDIKILSSTGRRKYRRAKLYFLRERQPKEYRVA